MASASPSSRGAGRTPGGRAAARLARSPITLLSTVPLSIPADYLRRAGFVALVIDLLALVSIWRSRKHSRKAKLVWTALVAVLPVLGGVAWFLLGRERRGNRHPPG